MAATPQRTDLNFDEFRRRLLKERADLLNLHKEQRADTIAEAREMVDNELSSYDMNEPGDISVLTYDHERDDALDSEIVAQIKQIDEALGRIEDGSYGICTVTGQPIPIERLRALPWASMTVEAAERVDH